MVVCFELRLFLPAFGLIGRPRERDADTFLPVTTRAMPYSFSNEPSGSFTCPVYSTDTWDLDLKSHPNDLVRRGIELRTPGLTYLACYP